MYTWVETSICGNFADITLVPDRANPTAFYTVRYHKDKWNLWTKKIAQSAVLVASFGECRGWSSKLLSEVNCHLKAMGVENAYLVTQITNKRMIRVIERVGYRLGRGELVCRIVL